MSKRAVITPYANQQTAINLSVVEGVPQCSFAGLATTDPQGGGPAPTHCASNGEIADEVLTLYEAQPGLYSVVPAAGRPPRTWTVVLSELGLVPWQGPLNP